MERKKELSKKHIDHLDCHCHKKKRKCECKKIVHCKVDKKLERDCIKTEWTVPKGNMQTVFQTGGFGQLFASGFVSYERGKAPFIIVRFFANGEQQGSDITVFEDSSVAFTYTKFDRVTVECPSNGYGVSTHNGISECEGELSITSRFPV